MQDYGPGLNLPAEITQTLATLREKGSAVHVGPEETAALRMSQNHQTMSMPDALEKTHDSIGDGPANAATGLAVIKKTMGSEGHLPVSPGRAAEITPEVTPAGTFHGQNSP